MCCSSTTLLSLVGLNPSIRCADLQDAFNLLPNLNVDKLSRSFAVKSNDMMLVIYLSSMVRSVLALHDLIDNREGACICSSNAVHHSGCKQHLQRRLEHLGRCN
jgi:Maintenance of mitochondrial structure and function